MKIEINVNNISYNSLISKGEIIANYLNEQEKDFRINIRKKLKKYENWVVDGYRKRYFISNGKRYFYKLCIYLDKKTNRKFVYYPCDLAHYLGQKRYLIEDVVEALKTNNFRRRSKEQSEAIKSKIPYDVLYYWLKIGYLKYEFKTSNKVFNKPICQVENDDAYIKLRDNKAVKKQAIRLVGLHNGYDKNKTKRLINKTLIFQFKSNLRVKTDLNFLISKTQEIIKNRYPKSSVILSGDGAKIIDKFATLIAAKRHFDLFHFHKILYSCFGYTNSKNKENKTIFGDVFGNQFNIFKTAIIYKKYELFDGVFNQSLDYLCEIKPQYFNKKIEIKAAFRLWKRHKKDIINSYENKNYFGGNAETFIGHYLKKYSKTPFCTFSREGLIRKIVFNLPKNIDIIFC